MSHDCYGCGNCSVCGFPFNRTSSGIEIMNSGIDAYIKEQDSENRPTSNLYTSVDKGRCEITNLSGFEKLQHPEDHQLQSLCDSLSQIKDCEIIESLLEKINVKFNKLFNINFSLIKEDDGTNVVEFC